METSQEFYIVEIHRISERARRLPPRRHIHSVHHTLQRAKFQAAALLRAAISNPNSDSATGDSSDESDGEALWNYTYIDGLSTGQVYSGYEITRPGRPILGIKFRRSTTYHSTPLLPKSVVTKGTAIVQPIVAISGKASKIQLINTRPAEVESDPEDSIPDLAESTSYTRSTGRSSVSSASSQSTTPPEQDIKDEQPRNLGAIPELLQRKAGRVSVYSLPGLDA